MRGMKKMAAAAMMAAGTALAGCATIDGSAGDGATAARDRGNPITAGPIAARCHMGGCGWFDVRSFEVVRETERGALIRLESRHGGSSHPGDQDMPTSARGVRIDWQPFHRNTWIFCSTAYPAIIELTEDGSYEGYRIDLTMPSGASEYITNQYVHVCHPNGELAEDQVEAARRLGYRPAGEEPMAFELLSPEQIFDRAGR